MQIDCQKFKWSSIDPASQPGGLEWSTVLIPGRCADVSAYSVNDSNETSSVEEIWTDPLLRWVSMHDVHGHGQVEA